MSYNKHYGETSSFGTTENGDVYGTPIKFCQSLDISLFKITVVLSD